MIEEITYYFTHPPATIFVFYYQSESIILIMPRIMPRVGNLFYIRDKIVTIVKIFELPVYSFLLSNILHNL
jgi:hypothetical protein